jgi:hypothetical protein
VGEVVGLWFDLILDLSDLDSYIWKCWMLQNLGWKSGRPSRVETWTESDFMKPLLKERALLLMLRYCL